MPTYTIKAWINIEADTIEQAQELLADFEDNTADTTAVSLSTEGELDEI